MLSACLFAPVSAQRDTGGETAFRQLEKEYRLGVRNSVAAWEDYLEQYPDSRHTNEVRSFNASHLVPNLSTSESLYARAASTFRLTGLASLFD